MKAQYKLLIVSTLHPQAQPVLVQLRQGISGTVRLDISSTACREIWQRSCCSFLNDVVDYKYMLQSQRLIAGKAA